MIFSILKFNKVIMDSLMVRIIDLVGSWPSSDFLPALSRQLRKVKVPSPDGLAVAGDGIQSPSIMTSQFLP